MEETKNMETKAAEINPAENKGNVTNSDTPTGRYTHKLAAPFEYAGKKHEKFDFDFEKLIGTDMLAIEDEMAAAGQYAISPEISTSFLSKMAARAAGVGSDVIEHLPLRDFGKIKNESRNFLISTGF